MIKSMTGYGRAQGTVKNKKVTVEVKSVNSKGLDLNTKLPSIYREKEIDIRKIVGASAFRGKVECAIYYDSLDDGSNVQINRGLVNRYYDELKAISEEKDIASNDLLSTIMRMPDVLSTDRPELDQEEWEGIRDLIRNALEAFNQFRADEGKVLFADFELRVNNILSLLEQVTTHEGERIENVKNKLNTALDELSQRTEIDSNRFEQELIYYLEKFDITEEKTRLKGHCDYFVETLNSEKSEGKKLGFISQEMGREINTLGAKSNHAELQKVVVQMKDELEKIKEQVLNVL